MNDHKTTARNLLASYDDFMAARSMDARSMEQFDAVCAAIVDFVGRGFVRGGD